MFSRFSGMAAAGLLAVLATIAMAPPAYAHHSATALYDVQKREKTTGVLKEVRWINPHIVVTIYAPDNTGKDVDWTFEGNPPSWFKRTGVGRKDFEKGLGDKVTIEYSPSRVGRPIGYFRQLTFADGTFLRFAEEIK